jgi:hypothetical protein
MTQRHIKDANQIPDWVRIGARVNYHSILNEPASQFDLEITAGPSVLGGIWVVWLAGKAGCVSVGALSKPNLELVKPKPRDIGLDQWEDPA